MGIWSRLFGAGEEEERVEAQAPARPQPRAALEQPTVESPRIDAPPPAPEPARPQTEQVPDVEPAVRAASDGTGPGAPADAAELEARLEELLDSLGSAHRRPFTRAG